MDILKKAVASGISITFFYFLLFSLANAMLILASRERTTINIKFQPSLTFMIVTVFTRIDAAAFISFFAIQLRGLFEGGVYSGAAFIQKSLYSVLNIVLHMVTFLLGNSNKSLHQQQNYALQKLNTRAKRNSHFELKNVVLKENKFPLPV